MTWAGLRPGIRTCLPACARGIPRSESSITWTPVRNRGAGSRCCASNACITPAAAPRSTTPTAPLPYPPVHGPRPAPAPLPFARWPVRAARVRADTTGKPATAWPRLPAVELPGNSDSAMPKQCAKLVGDPHGRIRTDTTASGRAAFAESNIHHPCQAHDLDAGAGMRQRRLDHDAVAVKRDNFSLAVARDDCSGRCDRFESAAIFGKHERHHLSDNRLRHLQEALAGGFCLG